MMINETWEHTADVQDIVDKVGVLINKLQNPGLHGNEIAHIETKLAAYYAFLAGKTAHYQTMMNAKYWIRKIAYSKQYAMLRGKANQGDAKVGAENLIDQEVNEEMEANYRFEHLKALCKGIELNLISVAHRLSQLRNEAKQQGSRP